MEEKLTYSLAEVEELTGWPEESIRRNCHDGKYEHIRRGRYYFMTRAQIDAMIEAHRQCRKPVEVDPVQAARQANIVRLRNRRRGTA